MKRAMKQTTATLPHVADSSSSSRKYVLGEVAEGSGKVFTPSALRTQQKRASVTSNRMFAAVLFGLFIVMLLLSFLVGINVYQSLNRMAEAESAVRLEKSFLANTIHSNDMYGAVMMAEGPEGKSLVLYEDGNELGGYETRIYAHEGMVVQEYALEGSPYDPEKAIPLFESETFDFAYDNGLLRITTDTGNVYVALRSGGGNS